MSFPFFLIVVIKVVNVDASIKIVIRVVLINVILVKEEDMAIMMIVYFWIIAVGCAVDLNVIFNQMEKLLLLIDAVIVIAKEHANHVLNVVVIFLILLEIVDVLAVEME